MKMYLHILAHPFKYQNTYNSSNAVVLVNPSTSNIPFLKTSPSLPWQRWLCLCSVHHPFANFSRLSWTRRTRIRTTNATQRRNRVLDLQIFKELCMLGKLLLPSFQAMFKAPMHIDRVQCLDENEYIQKKKPTRVECFLGFEYSYPLALAPCPLFWSHFATVRKAWMIERRSSALCDNSIPSSIGNNVKQPR